MLSLPLRTGSSLSRIYTILKGVNIAVRFIWNEISQSKAVHLDAVPIPSQTSIGFFLNQQWVELQSNEDNRGMPKKCDLMSRCRTRFLLCLLLPPYSQCFFQQRRYEALSPMDHVLEIDKSFDQNEKVYLRYLFQY